MDYIFVFIGFAVLLLGGWFAYRNRYSTSKCISCITVGIFFSTFFFLLPTSWVQEGDTVLFRPFYEILSSLFYSFRVLGGGQNLTQIQSVPLPTVLRWIYTGTLYLCFFLSPVLASGLVLSFFGDFGERMQYWFRFSKTRHVFSVLSENSLSMAKGIRRSRRGETIVFCGTASSDKKLKEQAKRLGAVLLYRPCEQLPRGIFSREYRFYLVAEAEDQNVNDVLVLIRKYRTDETHRVVLNAFARSGANIKVVEQTPCGGVEVRFVDEIALLCSQLLYKHPLYECATQTPEGDRKISVALVGGGRLGLQMLKTAVWYGQMERTVLKLRVYDKNAEAAQQEFFALYPELTAYDIDFIEADVERKTFEEALLREGLDTTYALIATGDDELNLMAADRLQGILRRANGFGETPPIFVRIRSSAKNKNLAGSAYLKERNISLLGSVESVYSSKTLFNTELERLALGVHLCYCGQISADPADAKYKEAVSSFLTCEYDRRSSLATALHLSVKQQMRQELRDQGVAEDEIIERLTKLEHDRWVAFVRSEGYRGCDVQTMELFARAEGKNRDERTKVHACICPWEALDALSDAYNALGISDQKKDFKALDRNMVVQMDEILQFAKKK